MGINKLIISGNRREISKGVSFIDKLPEELYNGQIGAQVRHVIEFYQALFAGYEIGTIDIVGRKRDKSYEEDKKLASKTLINICGQLLKFDNYPTDVPLLVRDEVDLGEIVCVPQTLAGVLYILLQHTTHHWGLIRKEAEKKGYDNFDPSFGYSFSTLTNLKTVRS